MTIFGSLALAALLQAHPADDSRFARALVNGRPLIAHNIGRGPELEDMLLAFPITGHYRYRGR